MTQEIKDYFDYKDGDLFWKKTTSNRVKIGQKAGYMRKGYLNVGFNGKEFPLHHIIFHMFHGFFPKIIDHIDGNKTNNRIENLRQATINENARNCKRPSHNTSGYKGVCWSKKDKKWQANITFNNRLLFLGLYKEKEKAYEAYCVAAKNLFGEFARLA